MERISQPSKPAVNIAAEVITVVEDQILPVEPELNRHVRSSGN